MGESGIDGLRPATLADVPEMVALADSGRLRVAVDRTYPLSEAAAAQSRLAEGGVRGKLVLEV